MKSPIGIESIDLDNRKILLIIGPLPPPMGGSGTTVQEIKDELARYISFHVMLINTSPSSKYKNGMTGFKLEKIRRSISVILQYLKKVSSCDSVLVFANNLFILTMVPVLVLMAKYFKKPIYIKPVGGDLSIFLKNQNKIIRKYTIRLLNTTDGILVQTRQLQVEMNKLKCAKAFYLQGFRSSSQIKKIQKKFTEELRIIFLGHITPEKGPLILIDALTILEREGKVKVKCDFYGLMHNSIRKEFFQRLKNTASARYCNEAQPGFGTRLISEYDVLVLPTYFSCEGHPGVIIESMHSAIPVISTQHRAIPELITNGENGILVPVRNSHALAEAIARIAADSNLREKMGRANFQRGREFITETVVAKMIKIIFPDYFYSPVSQK